MSAVVQPISRVTAAERLGNEITELCGYIAAATYHLLELLREFDTCRYWEQQGFRTCVEWLGFNCGLGPGAARDREAAADGGQPRHGQSHRAAGVAVPPCAEAQLPGHGRGAVFSP